MKTTECVRSAEMHSVYALTQVWSTAIAMQVFHTAPAVMHPKQSTWKARERSA